MGPYWGPFGTVSWDPLGALLGPSLAVLWRLGSLWLSWGSLENLLGLFGASWGSLELLLGRFWAVVGPSSTVFHGHRQHNRLHDSQDMRGRRHGHAEFVNSGRRCVQSTHTTHNNNPPRHRTTLPRDTTSFLRKTTRPPNSISITTAT